MIDLLVIGAGLTGLFASWHAARRGARTMLIAYGRGGLEPIRYGDWEVKGLASDF